MKKKSLTQHIEHYLMNLLKDSNDHSIEVNRISIANELGCAPSQVTYVLGTRFTIQKGFQVESRRGNGGFIRIEQMYLDSSQLKNRREEYSDFQKNKFDFDISFEELKEIPNTLSKVGIISNREVALVNFMLEVLEEWVPVNQGRNKIAQKLFHVAVKPENEHN